MKNALTYRTNRNRTSRMKSSAQARAERKQAAINRLKAFWKEYQEMTPDKQAVIETAARKLGSYSIRNQILIYLQAHAQGFDPSAVCPLSAWNKIGRKVKKGAKGLQILVPMVFKGTDAPAPDAGVLVPFGHDFEVNDGSTPGHTWFKVAYVFDLSQTELETPENGLPAPIALPFEICE